MTNSGNLQTAYTEKMRICAELSTAVQQWQLSAVCTIPATVSATDVIPHTLHDVLKQLDLTRFAVCDHREICNICTVVR